MRTLLCAAVAIAASMATAGEASAGQLLRAELSVPDPVRQSCIDHRLTGADGYAARSVEVPAAGWVTARLDAAAGDWDLALFDDATGDRVAGSAFFGSSEVAQGFVAGGEALTVQACRRSGDASRAALTVESDAVPDAPPARLSLVKVATPTAARRQQLAELGIDLTEHGGPGFVDVLLHGDADAAKLREANFIFTSVVADLNTRSASDRRADRGYRATVERSALPSGRTTYRRLADYGQEMKALAAANPSRVKPLTLPFKTLTGMSVEGIEITNDVNARDGKPVFLQLGAHHAREWPSSEHAIEWAHELVNGSNRGDPRVRRLLESTRTIVVPVVNPEGFNTSREAASALDDGRGGSDETPNLALPYEYQRKNCRVNNPGGDDPEQGDCTQAGQPSSGFSQFGVDPNRNYGGLWGGPGASPGGPAPSGDYAADYRGSAPFSEPETRNIRALVASRQVTTLITNHTFSNLILRPPGVRAQGPAFDEPVYGALGDAMAAKNGYTSEPAYQLYETTGTTEDWSYFATGGLGFTFEIGPSNFHPPYAQTVAEYEGVAPAAGAGKGGNREAYFTALESTANASRHALIEGGAPAGAVLRLKKTFKTSSSPVIDQNGVEGAPIVFDDGLDTTMVVPASGAFAWHVNPSTRPIVAQSGAAAPTESWSLTCELDGQVRASRAVTIERGERQSIDFGSACPRTAGSGSGPGPGAGPGSPAGRCASTRGGIRRTRVAGARLGRSRAFQRRLLRRVARLRSRRGTDRYCQAGGGALELGYPTARLLRALDARARERVRRRMVSALSTSPRLRVRGLRVGSPAVALRRRLRGERRLRVGADVWFALPRRRATLLLRTRRGRLRELGLANRSLTATRRGTARLLRSWR